MEENYFYGKLPYIDFVLSLMIVMHHSFNIDIDYNASLKGLDWGIERFFYNVSECAVPAFFFLSAVMFYRNYSGNKFDYLFKIRKRVYSLLVPYLIFNTLGYFKHIITSHESFALWGLIKSIITSDTMPLWFLRELFFLCLLAPIINKLRNHYFIIGGVTVIVGIFAMCGMIGYRSFLYWFPIYCIGASSSPLKLSQGNTLKIKNKNFSITVAVAIIMFSWLLPNSVDGNQYLGNLMFYMFRLTSVFVLIITIGWICQRKTMTKTPSFMRYSFWVYCVHFPLISLFQRGFQRIVINKSVGMNIIEYIATIAFAYVTAVFIAMALKKNMPFGWKILNGGRN